MGQGLGWALDVGLIYGLCGALRYAYSEISEVGKPPVHFADFIAHLPRGPFMYRPVT